MGNLFGLPDPPVDGFAGQVIQALQYILALDVAAVHPCPQHGGVHRAGQDGIDADVITGEFDGRGAGQRQQAAFTGGVGGDVG